jgi:hypothetical protein
MTLKEYCDVLRRNYGDSAAIHHVSQIAKGDNCVNVELLIERSCTREQLAVRIMELRCILPTMGNCVSYELARNKCAKLEAEYKERFLSTQEGASGVDANACPPPGW